MRSRSLALVGTLLAVVLAAAPAQAKGFGRGGGSKRSSGSSSSSSSSPSSSSSFGRAPGYSSTTTTPGWTSGGRTTVYVRPSYSYGYWYDPYWDMHSSYYGSQWGVYPWGYYAYGYHPYWGAPELPPQQRATAPSTTVAAFFIGGYGSGFGPELTGEVAIDGLHWGFNARGLTLGNPVPGTNFVDTMPLFGAHATYSFVSSPSMRIRGELGLSGIVAPDIHYYGPDVGASAQVALVGPLALEGAAHWTPWPASILDVEADVALHFGGFAVKGGLRALRLDDRAVNPEGDVLAYLGPQVSVGAIF